MVKYVQLFNISLATNAFQQVHQVCSESPTYYKSTELMLLGLGLGTEVPWTSVGQDFVKPPDAQLLWG